MFALSFGLFNTLCFLCKRQVMKANDQRTVRVPSEDGKTTDTKSVRAYDLEAIDLMMVKGTMVRPPHPPPRRHCWANSSLVSRSDHPLASLPPVLRLCALVRLLPQSVHHHGGPVPQPAAAGV